MCNPTNSGVVTLPVEELRRLTDIIQRVRDLANKFEVEEPRREATLTYELAAWRIFTALDGEQ